MITGASHEDVCVIIPIYNEAEVLGQVLSEVLASFSHVVVVDDGSDDGSHEIALGLGATVLRHPINLGQGAALQTGFDHVMLDAGIGIVVTIDGDGQHDVSDAVRMVDACRNTGADVVLGSRGLGAVIAQPVVRRWVLRLGLAFTRRTTGLAVSDTHNGLRVLTRRALAHIRLSHDGMAYASELELQIARSGLRWIEAPVSVRYTDYSRCKGQRNLNAVNILFDLVASRLRAAA